ncbi:GNAT family N-acetyltransferase [Undibacterium sp. RuTC16W]|uniref:GNAT family N-acetyltransferase n=1 Tax=Undibacterium sp. RuTC16W TaxID=3413048 RepID=UPI003BEFA685
MNSGPPVIVTVREPAAASAEELSAFRQFVLEGGEVNPQTLPGLVLRALSLALARVGEELVAVGAIKRPNPGYRAGVFAKAQVPQNPSRFEFELGWIYVRPSARGKGVASVLVGELASSLNSAPAYATSRVNNERMHAALKRFGFQPVGSPYPSQRNEPDIQLFLRE